MVKQRRLLIRLTLLTAVLSAVGIAVFKRFADTEPPRHFKIDEFDLEGGSSYRYSVFVPHVPPDSPSGYPVLLWLHGFDEGGTDGLSQQANNAGRQLWELKGRFPFLYLMPQSSTGNWNADELQLAIRSLDQVLLDYPADRDRVYVGGVSSGGDGVVKIIAAHPDRVAAAFAVSCTFGGKSIPELASDFVSERIPLWSAYAAADSLALVDSQLKLRAELVNQGGSPVFRQFMQSGHDSWNHGLRDPALYSWLLRHTIAGRNDETLYENLVDLELDKWIATHDDLWRGSIDRVIYFRSPTADPDHGESRLQLSRRLRDFDFHFDYRSLGTPHLELVVEFQSGPHGEMEHHGVRIIINPPNRGSGGIFDLWTKQLIADSSLLAQCSLRPNNWNDIRLRKAGNQITLWVNGWTFCQMKDEQLESQDVSVALVGRDSLGLAPKWREVRFRDLASDVKR